MNKKQILYIIIFTIICIILGYALYFVFFKKQITNKNNLNQNVTQTEQNTINFPNTNNGTKTNNTTTSSTNNNNNTIINNNNNNQDTTNSRFSENQDKDLVTKLTDIKTTQISPSTGNSLRFYNEQDGKFYRIYPNGTIQPISDKVFFNVSNVTWSPTTDESIIEYPDGANIYFNFQNNRQVTLPTHWEGFSFAKDGSAIVAKSLGLDNDNRWLVTSDPQGKNIKLIEPMGENANKVLVDWSPNRQIIAFSSTGESLGADRQEILPIGTNQENFKSLIVEGRGLEIQWSNDGTKLLHSVYSSQSNYKPSLWIADATPDSMGNNKKSLGVNTWASKCSIADSRFIYCGVPKNLETGSGFTPEQSKSSFDEIYKIDIQTGIKTIIPTENQHSIESLHVSEDGTTLYFTDNNTSGIFEVPLK